jgi:hypothetical protein
MRVWARRLEDTDRLANRQQLFLRLRRLDEADLLGDGDRLAPAGDAELAVDRDRLGLDRVPRNVQALSDLPEGQVRGEEREQTQLGAREPRACAGTSFRSRPGT